jgi:hypothetical protein
MTTPLFHLSLPHSSEGAHLAPLQIALEILAQIDEWHLRRSLRRAEKGVTDTVIPPVYAAGVSGRRRPVGNSEDWIDVPAALQQGTAGPEDLVAWRVAELRVSGCRAEPVVWRAPSSKTSGWGMRCAVRMPDGKIEDPSSILGAGPTDGRPAPASVLFHLSLPESADGSHFAPLQIALEGLTQIDEWQIRRSLRKAETGRSGTILPPLYAAGVVYEEEAPGREDWLDAPAVLRAGAADCEDLAAWRTAELRVAGYDAEPVIKWQWLPRDVMIRQGYPAAKLPGKGVWLVHCCVRWPDGTIEDPSKILGMGGNFTERI